MTITERITARLDAMESAARAATDAPESTWWVDPRKQRTVRGAPSTRVPIAESLGWQTAAHIALNDPAAVLALVDGLRAVVARHVSVECENYRCGNGGLHCAECDPHDGGPDLWPCPTLTALAAALDPVGEGSEGAEAAVEGPRSAATPVRRGPSHDDGCKDARETR